MQLFEVVDPISVCESCMLSDNLWVRVISPPTSGHWGNCSSTKKCRSSCWMDQKERGENRKPPDCDKLIVHHTPCLITQKNHASQSHLINRVVNLNFTTEAFSVSSRLTVSGKHWVSSRPASQSASHLIWPSSRQRASHPVIKSVEWLPVIPFTVRILVWSLGNNVWLLLISINIAEGGSGCGRKSKGRRDPCNAAKSGCCRLSEYRMINSPTRTLTSLKFQWIKLFFKANREWTDKWLRRCDSEINSGLSEDRFHCTIVAVFALKYQSLFI